MIQIIKHGPFESTRRNFLLSPIVLHKFCAMFFLDPIFSSSLAPFVAFYFASILLFSAICSTFLVSIYVFKWSPLAVFFTFSYYLKQLNQGFFLSKDSSFPKIFETERDRKGERWKENLLYPLQLGVQIELMYIKSLYRLYITIYKPINVRYYYNYQG